MKKDSYQAGVSSTHTHELTLHNTQTYRKLAYICAAPKHTSVYVSTVFEILSVLQGPLLESVSELFHHVFLSSSCVDQLCVTCCLSIVDSHVRSASDCSIMAA